MNKQKIIILISILILITIAGILFLNTQKIITGEIIKDKYSFTKAICNETNYCEDYEIVCENGKMVSLNPTGSAIQHEQEWKDPRNKELIERLC